MAGVEDRVRPFEAEPKSGRAKVFMHGGSQAVRLPKAYRVEGEEVSVRREGDRIILEPIKPAAPRTEAEWAAFWKAIDDNSGGDFPEREQPPMQERDYGW